MIGKINPGVVDGSLRASGGAGGEWGASGRAVAGAWSSPVRRRMELVVELERGAGRHPKVAAGSSRATSTGTDLVESGADAKPVVQDGLVRVNGEVETRRGRQLHPGDVVELAGVAARVVEASEAAEEPDELPW